MQEMRVLCLMRTAGIAALAIGLVAGAATTAKAQTIDPFLPEITFNGQLQGQASGGLSANGSFNMFEGVGTVTGLPLFFVDPIYTGSTANYTFGLNGLTLVSDSIEDGQIVANYSGQLVIYRDTNGYNYGTGSAANLASFRDGTQYLIANDLMVTSRFNPTGSNAGQGTVAGDFTITGGTVLPLLLASNPGATAFNGTFTQATIKTVGVVPGYSLRVDGSADITAIPEPGTLALAGVGLLPLAGLIRRRRKAA